MRLRFWRRKPKSFNLGTHRIKVKGDPKKLTPEVMVALNTELQHLSLANMQNQITRYYDEIIGLRTQVRDLNVKLEKLTAKVEKLEAKNKSK